MQLFAIFMDPLLCALESALMAIRVSSNSHISNVIAYADDIKLLLTSPSENTHGSGNVGHNSENSWDIVP